MNGFQASVIHNGGRGCNGISAIAVVSCYRLDREFRRRCRTIELTQSALSHQIKQLEDELSTTLLVRARPQVYLTEAGRWCWLAAERVMAELDEWVSNSGWERKVGR